jgi:hypothetical protein
LPDKEKVVLELRGIFQTEDYQSPFNLRTPGFNDRWWGGRLHRLAAVGHDTFIVLDGVEEVARAEVDPKYVLAGHYVGLRTPRSVVNVGFFEVRADLRLRGYGQEAVELLIHQYPGRDLIAFSEQADHFWAGSGWVHFPRADGSRRHQPLFAHLNH